MSNNSTIKIELTAEEANSLLQLLNIATKAAGLEAAQTALPLAIKITAASRAAQQEQAPPEKA